MVTAVPWLYLMGELSAQPTEGENLCRRTGRNSKCALSLLPPTASAPSSSEEGKVTAVPWLYLMGELSAQPTEGENLRRRTDRNSKCALPLLPPTASAPSSSEEGKVTADRFLAPPDGGAVGAAD